MNYKPDEKDWMSYLYGEMDAEEKARFEQYLLQNEDARNELQRFHGLRKAMSSVEEQEVIAPPIVFSDSKPAFWEAPYFRTIMSIAASLLILLLVGKMTGARVSFSNQEFKMAFGETKNAERSASPGINNPGLTEQEVQQMINKSLASNNLALQEDWKETQVKLTNSIRQNLAINSTKVDELMREASTASQEQIRQFVSTMQADNIRQVKDYFQLTSTEQKTYIENLLVDFADYLQQQRNNDLQLVQLKMNSLEKNTDLFKQETEQILASIITTVGAPADKEVKN